jgi:membrane protease YdiL (CAAX protease family)
MNLDRPELSDPPQKPAASVEVDAPDPAHPRRAFTVSDLFLGADGLRAAWGIALFLLFRELLSYCIFPLLQALFPISRIPTSLVAPRPLFVFEGGGLLCLLGATWLMAKIELREMPVYGFGPQRRLRNFCMGLGWGVGLLSLLVAVLRAAGWLVFDERLLFGPAVIRYGLLWIGGFLLVGTTEEVFLRGYLQFTLTRGLSGIYRRFFGRLHANSLGFWSAAVVLSVVFGADHASNPGESPLGIIAAGLVGLVFCLSLWRTGSLWWAIGFHAAWDWAQSFLFGVPDSGLAVEGHLFATHPVGRAYLSGGATGPEGSVFLIPILAAAVAAIVFTLPRTHAGYTSAGASQPSLH